MFERFGNMPLHVLVIHLTVVVLPVAALTAIAFAVVPKWRWFLRWPTLILGLGALVCAFVAKKSGDAFVAAVPQLVQLVRVHRSRGNLLLWLVLAFAVLVVIAFFFLSDPRPRVSGKGVGTARRNRPLELVVSAAVVVMAVVVIYQTVRTGDAGARAVWGNILPK